MEILPENLRHTNLVGIISSSYTNSFRFINDYIVVTLTIVLAMVVCIVERNVNSKLTFERNEFVKEQKTDAKEICR